MVLKNIWKITLLLFQGRCQYVQSRIDERIFEALKKTDQASGKLASEVRKKNNPKLENVSFSKNSSSGG